MVLTIWAKANQRFAFTGCFRWSDSIPRRIIQVLFLLVLLQSVDEVGATHISPYPTRPQGAHNLLSHLPLHSQQPSRAKSLLIPIGGIHMVQPRSLLPLYSLVGSAIANPMETSWRHSEAPEGRSSFLLQCQDSLKETSSSSRARLPDPKALRGVLGSSQSDALLHGKSQGCSGVQQQSRAGSESKHWFHREVCLPWDHPRPKKKRLPVATLKGV